MCYFLHSCHHVYSMHVYNLTKMYAYFFLVSDQEVPTGQSVSNRKCFSALPWQRHCPRVVPRRQFKWDTNCSNYDPNVQDSRNAFVGMVTA